ncbi:MAG TPA: alkyl sulfatase dimerization domain-containing protein [Smithella sp.]|nr:alkyl sulfatase dimerization domain-containing protein [Smithella sp.]HNY50639.1 alkyl sulfatase dimerization domain-containing protein [Smithella sp.]HOG89206.1 alkyl sulfatase dimerization domain-containing protein [Smithella sp.]
MNPIRNVLLVVALIAIMQNAGCVKDKGVGGISSNAMPITVAANRDMAQTLNFKDLQDFEEAKRGLIAKPNGQIRDEDDIVLIDFDHFKFVAGDSPLTVNPSLWRHASLNTEYGLFKVVDGIYQLRGFDIANMTLIEGKTGWIVVDTLTCRETAAYAYAFARKYLGEKPLSAIIITHSHVDHFGGVLGITSPQEVEQRKLPVIAPEGFLEEAISENILVGSAMARRSVYQYGRYLDRSVKGLVDNGIGKEVAYGSVGIIKPNIIINKAQQELMVDGVRFVFYNVPDAEAPAELTFTIPEKKAYCGAEILSHTMHNLLTLRGAKVRDSLRWGHYLNDALEHAAEADVCFGQHNWPVWGQDRVREFITKQRDVYLYMHDQTVRLINAGYTPREIADKIKLPKSLESCFGARGYYGALRHNVKAVYQHYIGFYDGNPANLNLLPPQESAKHYVDLIGGADKATAAAQAAFDKGEYRWVAELLNNVVYAAPEHKGAKELLARTYEQMGYMCESAIWRNSYLTAAHELRQGPPKIGYNRAKAIDILDNTPTEYFLEAMAASLDGPAAEDKNLKINLVFSDTGETFVLWIENAVLHHRSSQPVSDANTTMTLTKPLFLKMLVGKAGIKDTLFSDDLKINGNKIDLMRFFSLFDKANDTFPIVTPK